jgi:hypothetical protein
MSEEEKIEQSQEGGKPERPQQPLTINNEPSTNMEVHYHPHVDSDSHRKKNFKEYFLEFLMIFLAVTMGFIAENLREKITDRRQVHNYMLSMINDLQNDLVLYRESMDFNDEHRNMIDTIINSISQNKNNMATVYYDARKLTLGSTVITPDSKTFEQMKSNSGFRLIEKRAIADSISSYYQWIKDFEYWSDLQRQRINDVIAANDKLFNAVTFFSILKNMQSEKDSAASMQTHPELITKDPLTINSVLMQYQYYYGMLNLMDERCIKASHQAATLIEQIKKEYHLSEGTPLEK